MWHTLHTQHFHGSRLRRKGQFHKSSDADMLCLCATDSQLPLPRPDLLVTLLVLRRWIGIIPTAHEFAPSVWRCTSHSQVMSPTCPSSGARFFPTVDMTRDDYDTNSHMSDIPFVFSRQCKMFHLTTLHWYRSHVAEGDFMRNVPRLHPIPTQTGVNPSQQNHSSYLQGSPAVLGPQETVQVSPQRARDAVNVQRETARRALLHQLRAFLAVTHQYEAVAR